VSASVPGRFDVATSPRASLGRGRFEVALDEQWTVMGKPNGGYLVAVLAQCGVAALEEERIAHPHCISAATTFLGAAETTTAEVVVTILRQGRGATQLRATLLQGGAVLVESLMVFAALDKDTTRLYDILEPMELPDPAACIRIPSTNPSGAVIAIMDEVEILMDPATMDWSRGLEGTGELRGWVRFPDDRRVDATSLTLLIDCFPPATFPLGSSGWVPTLQLTSYVRALPAPGPVKIRQRVQVIEGGFVDEVCEIWDSTGQLVAQGTQLAMVRFA
jgi:acyl-CoA thioesterase